MTEITEKIKKLREELTRHAKLYYVYDAPVISDYEYDMMYHELKKLEGQYPELDDPNSPTHRVPPLLAPFIARFISPVTW